MSDSPRTSFYIPSYVQIERPSENTAVISWPRETKTLEGESVDLISEILPLLKKGSTVEEIVNRTKISRAEAEELLGELQQIGILRTENGDSYDFLEWTSLKPKESQEKLQNSTVAVLTSNNDLEFNVLRKNCNLKKISDIEDLEKTENIDLLITFKSGVSPSFHHQILEISLDRKIPWLPARLVGKEIRVGPLTRPRKGKGCYRCYFLRMIASERESESEVKNYEKREETENWAPYPQTAYEMMKHTSTMEALSFLGKYIRPSTVGATIYLDFLKTDSSRSDVIKIPSCDFCGE